MTERVPTERVPTENVRKVLNTAMRQQRFREFRLDDPRLCSIAVDFITDEPKPIGLDWMNDEAVVEPGVDTLRLVAGGQRCYVLPTQWRRLGLDSPESLREFLLLRFPDVDVSRIQAFLFRPDSYVFDAAGWRAFRLTTPSNLSSAAERVESADARSRVVDIVWNRDWDVNDSCAANVDWQRIKQLSAAQLPDGRLAGRSVADGSELEPEGRVGNSVDDLWEHCQGLMALLRYSGEANDLSVMPQITAAVGYLVACMEPGRSDEPPQSVATAKWDEKTCRAVATVLRGYEALTGDVQYRLIGQRYFACIESSQPVTNRQVERQKAPSSLSGW